MSKNIVSDKQSLNKMNKIMLRETLQKLHINLSNKDFRKNFMNLFLEYLDINNRDSNAHYHKILKILEEAGFTKEEAEDFFKDTRVNNKNIIVKLSKLQNEIEKANEQYRANRWKVMANPLSLKSIAVLYLNLYKELEAEFKKMIEELKLKLRLNGELQKQIKRIEKILGENVKNLEKVAKSEEFLIVDKASKDANQIKEIFEDMKAELLKTDLTKHYLNKMEQDVTEDISNMDTKLQNEVEEVLEKKEDKKEITEPGKEGREKNDIFVDESEEKQYKNELEKNLDYCLQAVVSDLKDTKNLDKKTLSFYTLSEYLHSYNNANFKEFYEHFKDILNTSEFSAIVVANTAAMNSDLDYNILEKTVKNNGVEGIVKIVQDFMQKDESKDYKKLFNKIKNELEGRSGIEKDSLKKQEKELVLGQPKKTKTKTLAGPGF